MANNPKKVKDPTEVALSAIQEALNIGEASPADLDQAAVRHDAAPPIPSPAYGETGFDARPNTDRPAFESADESRFATRPRGTQRRLQRTLR